MLAFKSIAACLTFLLTAPMLAGCIIDPSGYTLSPDEPSTAGDVSVESDGDGVDDLVEGLVDGGVDPGSIDAASDAGSIDAADDGTQADAAATPDVSTPLEPRPSAGGICQRGDEDCRCEGTTCTCTDDCEVVCDTDCELRCRDEARCKYESLGAGAEVFCEPGAACKPIKCVGDCTVRCGDDSDCVVHCDQSLGSSCLLFCDPDADDCKIDKCGINDDVEPVDCGGGVHTCNHACP